MAFDLLDDQTDDQLLAAYAEGDQAAARALMLRLAPQILSLSTRMLKDRSEAEDVTQEAMLRLWRIAPDWREGEAKVSTWLYRVAANLCTDRLRRKKGQTLDDVPEIEDTAPNAEAQLIAADRSSVLRAAVEKLPDRQKMALSLRHFEELSNPEIAEIMGTTVEATESLLSRARRTLTAQMEKHRETLGFAG